MSDTFGSVHLMKIKYATIKENYIHLFSAYQNIIDRQENEEKQENKETKIGLRK